LEQNPVTILKELQKCLVEGRVLEITDLTADNSGITNFIMVDRGEELLKTAFDELKCMTYFSRTLEVQFYGEVFYFWLLIVKVFSRLDKNVMYFLFL